MHAECACETCDLEDPEDPGLGHDKMQVPAGISASFEGADKHAEGDGVKERGVEKIHEDVAVARREELGQSLAQLRRDGEVDFAREHYDGKCFRFLSLRDRLIQHEFPLLSRPVPTAGLPDPLNLVSIARHISRLKAAVVGHGSDVEKARECRFRGRFTGYTRSVFYRGLDLYSVSLPASQNPARWRDSS